MSNSVRESAVRTICYCLDGIDSEGIAQFKAQFSSPLDDLEVHKLEAALTLAKDLRLQTLSRVQH